MKTKLDLIKAVAVMVTQFFKRKKKHTHGSPLEERQKRKRFVDLRRPADRKKSEAAEH